MRIPLMAAVAVFCSWNSAGAEESVDAKTAAGIEFFESKIRPVLVTHCYECHNSSTPSAKGNLRLDHREGLRRGGDSGPAIVEGRPDESLLIQALKFDGLEMPPKGKLSPDVVQDFIQWIRMGAPDPRERPANTASAPVRADASFWSLQRPRVHPRPEVADASWPIRELDWFILSRLEQQGLRPSLPAERRRLIRRLTLDVTGLPPSPEEVEAFVNDTTPEAYAAAVERLLNSPHYGERWGRHWLDVARYAEDQAHTFKARNYPQGFRYRDWVVEALNRDLPYNQFVAEQIAGDILGSPADPRRLAALGLFALGPVYYQDNGEQAKALADEWDDRVDTLTRGVLGLTIACARCHDHKYDPISTADYYGLAGVFASSEYQERPIVSQEVLDRKRAADDARQSQQLQVDRFLDQQARRIRDSLTGDIPLYLKASWTVLNRKADKPGDKKVLEKVAEEFKVSATLLKRWVDTLTLPEAARTERPYLAPCYAWLAQHVPGSDSARDGSRLTELESLARDLQATVESRLPEKERLFRIFGDHLAFVTDKDRATVVPGIIPLGNLFDDTAGTALASALATDVYASAASDRSLGVDRVVQGWGGQATIAEGIAFDFTQLGSDDRAHGAVVNDAWDATGAIRTVGKPSVPRGRQEQGVGMHANALITFDLDELRQAGLLPPDQPFVFRVDRAGLNDDTFGGPAPSAHLAVIVSRPHRAKDVYDAVQAGYVNGQKVDVVENDRVYYFSGQIPEPLKADGRFVPFQVPVPGDARYLTLVSTGAGLGPDGNTINSDHTVFSGARLEQDPLPEMPAVAEAPAATTERETDRSDARLLSEFLHDRGLLALPGSEADTRLPEPVRQELSQLRAELDRRTQAVNAIRIEMAHSLTEGAGRDLKIYLQGNPQRQGDSVPRSLPVVLTGGQRRALTEKGSGRAELARAICSDENPLTARVIVNRVWASHFGTGLVKTPSNFGQLGERPSHPELLDTLAVRFIESGWSLKWLHREILTSAAYRQDSAFRDEPARVDPENRLLWRMSRRRLEVEPWRDSMLAVTGELDRTVGGPPQPLEAAGNRRRTLYAFVSRHQLNELLRLFDFPDPNITSDRRTVTTVPLQQLFVLNSDFMVQRAQALAKRLATEPDDASRIRLAFSLLFSRPPTAEELQLGLSFIQTPGEAPRKGLSTWEQYALALLGTNEFSFVD